MVAPPPAKSRAPTRRSLPPSSMLTPKSGSPVIVVGEYRFGLTRSRARQQLRDLLDQLIAESDVLEVDLETASVYAEIRTRLRERGEPIPENDIWIGALCLQHRMALVSRDAHFDSILGLQRWTW